MLLRDGSPDCQLPLPVPPVSRSLAPNIALAVNCSTWVVSSLEPTTPTQNMRDLLLNICRSMDAIAGVEVTPFSLWAWGEIFPYWWLSKQAKMIVTPGNLWLLVLLSIPICTCCQGKRKVPFWCGDHWMTWITAHPSARTALIEVKDLSQVMLCWSSKIQACVHPTV